MPIYEYCCDSCMHRFELKRSFNDNSAVSCPKCSSDVRQIFSPAPIIFKGSGFYVTDVKRAGDNTHTPPTKDKEPPKETAEAKKPADSKGGVSEE
jgi:putative FmdB family regulatory protein